MIDIKKIKKELLEEFNSATAAPATIMQEDTLDTGLCAYFSKSFHMPKELIFEAILSSLNIEKHDQPISRHKVKSILDRNENH